MKPTVLVTGAGGFIGSHIADALVADGCRVIGLVRQSSQLPLLRSRGIEGKLGDITKASTLKQATAGCDVVVHAAAKVTDWGEWSSFYENTVIGTRNVVQAALEAGVSKLVYISSVVVYDDRETRKCRTIEENCPQGERGDRLCGSYARAKVLAEAAVGALAPAKMSTVILRPAFVYGPRDRTILPRLLEYLAGPTAAWIGYGDPTIDPIYVTDVAACALHATLSDAGNGQAFNVAPDREIGVKQFISQLCETFEIPLPRWRLPYWAAFAAGSVLEEISRVFRCQNPPSITRAGVAAFAEDRHHTPQLMMKTFGWRPSVPLAEGLCRTHRWLANTAGLRAEHAA